MAQKAPGKAHRKGISLIEITAMFPTDEAAQKWIEAQRWPDGPVCPHCGSLNVQAGIKHRSMTHRCRDCPNRAMFSLKTGTVMHRTQLGYREWAIGIYLLATNLKGVSSMKLHRDLNITQKSAWYLAHRLREGWKAGNGDMFTGPVEADETYIGGKRKNMPKAKRKTLMGRGAVGKTAVVGVKDRATNRVVARSVTATDKPTLQGFVAEHAAPDAKVFTDDASAYEGLPFDHEAVCHSAGEYVRGMAHTNGVESFWSMLKRGYNGTFHHFSEKHLDRYVGEFAGRHNDREADTIDMMGAMVTGLEGKHLPVSRPDCVGADVMSVKADNRLYFGDCLDVMREDIDDESIDLIYLDPPFNSKRLYNAFIGGAQWVAFDDTWSWHEAVDDFHEVAADVGLADTIEGLKRILGEGAQLAYLSYMANRLRECRRVLKRTGSIYLHCDPTMSHYLKVMMDGIFEHQNFRNEIIWSRSKNPKGSQYKMKHFSPFTDTILYYVKSRAATIHLDSIRVPLTHDEFKRKYPYRDKHGQYADGPILRSNSMESRPNLVYTYKGFTPGLAGWRVRREELERIDKNGNLAWTKTGGVRRKLRPSDIEKGKPIGSLWDDIAPINSQAKERMGYPTQKPLKLLERIIKASTSEGELVLDPFCGCGTTIHAAQALQRRWVGIDVCVNACRVIEGRLRNHFDSIWNDVQFIGMPKTRDDAKTLADLDKFRFERWAASLVHGMEANKSQRGDKGIDGRGRIPIRKGQFIDIVSQVKGGGTSPGDVQAFNGARQQAGADLGVFTCFKERVTPRMRDAAASAGRFMEVPTIQIYTIEDFFEGRKPEMPRAA